MELRSSIAFIGETSILEEIDSLISEGSIIDDMVFSIDFIPELETSDTYVYRCDTDGDSWINIYDIETRLNEKLENNHKFDIIYASTDSQSYVDVISISANFDAYVDTDMEKIKEICDTYGLEFYGNDDSEDYFDDIDEEDDYY